MADFMNVHNVDDIENAETFENPLSNTEDHPITEDQVESSFKIVNQEPQVHNDFPKQASTHSHNTLDPNLLQCGVEDAQRKFSNNSMPVSKFPKSHIIVDTSIHGMTNISTQKMQPSYFDLDDSCKRKKSSLVSSFGDPLQCPTTSSNKKICSNVTNEYSYKGKIVATSEESKKLGNGLLETSKNMQHSTSSLNIQNSSVKSVGGQHFSFSNQNMESSTAALPEAYYVQKNVATAINTEFSSHAEVQGTSQGINEYYNLKLLADAASNRLELYKDAKSPMNLNQGQTCSVNVNISDTVSAHDSENNVNVGGDLLNSVKENVNEKPFNYQLYREASNKTENLNRPIREQAVKRPFKCGTCQKRFIYKRNLTRHIKTHIGVKPFKCGTCQKRFINKEYLTRHIKTHIGVKTFKCEICQKAFIWKSDLKRHLPVHAKKKPYKCQDCSKAFAQSSYCNMHMRTQHGRGTSKIVKHAL